MSWNKKRYRRSLLRSETSRTSFYLSAKNVDEVSMFFASEFLKNSLLFSIFIVVVALSCFRV